MEIIIRPGAGVDTSVSGANPQIIPIVKSKTSRIVIFVGQLNIQRLQATLRKINPAYFITSQ
jgi:hypothetical protein